MAETIRELVSEKAVDERIVELGKQISKEFLCLYQWTL